MENKQMLVPFNHNRSVQVLLRGFGGSYVTREKGGIQRLLALAEFHGLKKLYIPDTTNSDGFIVFDSGLFGPLDTGNMNLQAFNDCEADGMILHKGEAVAFHTGDCPVVIMEGPGMVDKIAVAHAGRKSLIGDFVSGNGKSARHSVIANMLSRCGRYKDRINTNVKVVLGISANYFLHEPNHSDPKYAEANKKLIARVCEDYSPRCFFDLKTGALSLFEIIKAQCEYFGIPGRNVTCDDNDTYSQKNPDGSYIWYSNRRGDTGRNLVLVCYC